MSPIWHLLPAIALHHSFAAAHTQTPALNVNPTDLLWAERARKLTAAGAPCLRALYVNSASDPNSAQSLLHVPHCRLASRSVQAMPP
jgi:hypothetical protein